MLIHVPVCNENEMQNNNESGQLLDDLGGQMAESQEGRQRKAYFKLFAGSES